MNYILYAGIIIYLFVTTTVAAYLGIESVGAASTLLIVVSIIYKISKYRLNNLISKFNIEFKIFVFGLFLLLLKFIINDFNVLKQILFFLLIPPFVSILISLQNIKSKSIIKNIIVTFYVAECILAIYEKLFAVNFFPYDIILDNGNIKDFGFRSTAFLGHPLANALCVSTIMGFILTSAIKSGGKIILIAIGYIAIMAFNARAAMLIWTIIVPIYFMRTFYENRKRFISFKTLLFSIISIFIIYNLVMQGFGDRFFQGAIIDGSSMTRVDVFRSFEFINSKDFWFGNSSNYLPVMEKLNAGGVENSYIVVALNYGIVAAFILFVLYFFWVKRFLQNYTRFDKLIIIMAFVIVGSTNNSLAGSVSWMIFIFCVNSFNASIKEKPIFNKQNSLFYGKRSSIY